MEPSPQQTSPAIPIAIISGFAMIAIAIFFTSGKNSSLPSVAEQNNEAAIESSEPRPVDENDYIRGNPNAPILMVEYSDYDCPFCKQFHSTMNQIMDEYGITGRVAWVYRQFPVAQLHPNSPKISKAALCVGDIGGNNAFWTFSDLIFDDRDIDSLTNVTKLSQYAEIAGVAQEDYIACMSSDEMEKRVEQDVTDGFNAGARGTPYTVLIVGSQQAVISGAQPYDTVKGIIDNLIEQLDGEFDVETAEPAEIPVNENGVPILE
tara:strand:- start:1618 stop:2406 length:789 start_codon:yes stop_codon:yes gene_type:complete